MMKHTLKPALVLLISAFFSVSVQADSHKEKMHGMKHNKPAKHLKHMQEKLKLSDSQVEQIRPLLEQQHTQIRAIRMDTRGKVSQLLTEEQREKFKDMKHKHGHHEDADKHYENHNEKHKDKAHHKGEKSKGKKSEY